MSQIFELKDPFILGDKKDDKYGWSWRSNTDGDLPVQFSSHKDNIMPGVRIMAGKVSEKTAKSSGKPYLWLSEVKFEDSPTEQKELPPFEKKPEPTFKKSEQAYLRDATTVPIDMIRALLPYFNVQTLLSNPDEYMTLIETARQLTEDALTMVDAIRSGSAPSGADVPIRQPEIKEEVAPAAGYEKFKKAKEAMTATDEYGEYEG